MEEGKVECEECSGSGYELRRDDQSFIHFRFPCQICHGSGELDWIENIVGRGRGRVKPGVYIRSLDSSVVLPSAPGVGSTVTIDREDCEFINCVYGYDNEWELKA